MSLSTSLLYLLLLYAVLDPERKMSLSVGMAIAVVILLFNCYRGSQCRPDPRRFYGAFPPPPPPPPNIFADLNF